MKYILEFLANKESVKAWIRKKTIDVDIRVLSRELFRVLWGNNSSFKLSCMKVPFCGKTVVDFIMTLTKSLAIDSLLSKWLVICSSGRLIIFERAELLFRFFYVEIKSSWWHISFIDFFNYFFVLIFHASSLTEKIIWNSVWNFGMQWC
jgi:hypothetical protein